MKDELRSLSESSVTATLTSAGGIIVLCSYSSSTTVNKARNKKNLWSRDVVGEQIPSCVVLLQRLSRESETSTIPFILFFLCPSQQRTEKSVSKFFCLWSRSDSSRFHQEWSSIKEPARRRQKAYFNCSNLSFLFPWLTHCRCSQQLFYLFNSRLAWIIQGETFDGLSLLASDTRIMYAFEATAGWVRIQSKLISFYDIILWTGIDGIALVRLLFLWPFSFPIVHSDLHSALIFPSICSLVDACRWYNL